MEIKKAIKKSEFDLDKRYSKLYNQLDQLIAELSNRTLTDEVISAINLNIDAINNCSESAKKLKKQMRKSLSSILKLLEKELKLVTKNHYRNTWMVIGMSAFGIPIGAAFGATSGNMGFLGLGLPIGMVIGLAIGTQMDKKAFDSGKQIDLEIS